MADDLAEQPKNQVQEQAQRKQDEYNRFIDLLKERVEEWNANPGDKPEIIMKGSSSLEMGPFTLCLEFDQVPHNPTEHVLVFKVGVNPFKEVLGFRRPRFAETLQTKISNDGKSILWESKLYFTLITSDELARYALRALIDYYRRHMPKRQN